ncbi:MAG: methyltransferase domain-containing protein [Candidatus Altiarchaeota archaeon]
MHNPRSIFGDYIGKGDSILDLGCGSGTFTFALAEMVEPKRHVTPADYNASVENAVKAGLKPGGI